MDKESIHYLDNVGPVAIAIDKCTHEVLILIKTPVGVVTESLDREKALRLGIELVRVSGKTFRFTAEEGHHDCEIPGSRGRCGGRDPCDALGARDGCGEAPTGVRAVSE